MSEDNYQPNWIPLPTWRFKIPTAQLKASDFVKSMFRMLARTFFDLFPSPNDRQFVLLCKLTQSESDFEFSVWEPIDKSAQVVIAHLPPRMTAAESTSNVSEINIEIRHQYGILADTLTPVTVVYRPNVKHVTFTNQKQMASPDEFIRPQLCKTTSGFLNFLGSLELKRTTTDKNGPVVLFEELKGVSTDGLEQWFLWFQHLTGHARWETQRILINSENPEVYRYDYEGN